MANHPFVILSYKDAPVEIDSDIAPLIQKLWGLGIATSFCCQGEFRADVEAGLRYMSGYISFTTKDDFFQFIDLCGGLRVMFNHVKQVVISELDDRVSVYFYKDEIPGIFRLVTGASNEG